MDVFSPASSRSKFQECHVVDNAPRPISEKWKSGVLRGAPILLVTMPASWQAASPLAKRQRCVSIPLDNEVEPGHVIVGSPSEEQDVFRSVLAF